MLQLANQVISRLAGCTNLNNVVGEMPEIEIKHETRKKCSII